MENRGLLAIIAVLLLGIFTVMVIELNEQSPQKQMAVLPLTPLVIR